MVIPDDWTEADIEAAIERAEDLHAIPIVVSLHPLDCKWSERICLRLANHSDSQVRANAILGFGHLARVSGELTEATVKPVIEAGLREEQPVRGQAWAAADDVTHFLGWQISGFDGRA